jgi:hypothetical protein
MTFGGSEIVENIYLDESKLEVTFVKQDGQGEVRSACAVVWLPSDPAAWCMSTRMSHPPLQHYNTVVTDPASSSRFLKFGLRDAATKQPLHWDAPADIVAIGIKNVFARALQLQHDASAAAKT